MTFSSWRNEFLYRILVHILLREFSQSGFGTYAVKSTTRMDPAEFIETRNRFLFELRSLLKLARGMFV